MIGNSWPEWVLIQVSVIIFRFNPLIYILSLLALCAHSVYQPLAQQHYTAAKAILTLLLVAEAVFYKLIYQPHIRRAALTKSVYPEPLTKQERRALFRKCLGHATDAEQYLRGWFHNAELSDIRRDNLREFFLWAFFEMSDEDLEEKLSAATRDLVLDEVDEYVAALELRVGHAFGSGRGNATSLRLNLEPVVTAYRGLAWYFVIFLVDVTTHAVLRWNGFRYYARGDAAEVLATFPPRPQELLSRYKSPAPGLGYWHYDGSKAGTHSNSTKKQAQQQQQLPVVFLHGIGVGLLTYLRFLIDLIKASNAKEAGKGQGDDGTAIRVIAVEMLPVSFRLTAPPLDKRAFLTAFTTIIDSHGWDDFAIVSHSYGSVPTTHILAADAALSGRAKAATLVDPVTIMLHLPHVAYNFTRRRPRTAAEWQLWYFASSDVGVATVLGRHFFWRQNIIWKEEMLRLQNGRSRRITVSLAATDIIVNAPAVAEYLAETDETLDAGAEQSRVGVLWFPNLDHAQVFDTPRDYDRIIERVLAQADED